jgi:hypothetical protein
LLSTSVLRPGAARTGTPVRSASFATVDAAAKAAIIASDAVGDTVDAFTTAGKMTAQVTGFNEPQGISADKSGNIYIADTGNSDIPVYSAGLKSLTTTLTDPGEYPADVDIFPTTGVVAVTNILSTAFGAGSVSLYAKGATTPCVTVANSTWLEEYFGAFDKSGNFYVDGRDANGNFLVGVVTGGCSATTITTLTIGNTISFPGGVQVTKKGDVAILDQLGYEIYTYKPALKGSLGAPLTSTPLTGASDPVSFAFNSSLKDVFTADAGLAEVLSYAFPAGGSPIKTISGLSQPIGVVTTPVELP